MLARNPSPGRAAHSSTGSASVDDLQSTRPPTLQESVRALRAGTGTAGPASISPNFAYSENPNLKPALKSTAQAPKLQVGTKKPSPLHQSDSAHASENNNNLTSPLTSPVARSPRERLEAFLASESGPTSAHLKSNQHYSSHALLRNFSAPVLPTSPPISPKNMLSSRTEPRADMARNHSIDSDNSTSSKTTESNRSTPNKAAQGASGNSPFNDVAGLVAAAGSMEAALFKLWKEKQITDSHNDQLWRLMEKQRAMILGLNKDLEKAVSDRDRYRKKLKQVTQNTGSVSNVHRTDSALDRAESMSPGSTSGKADPVRPIAPQDVKPVEMPQKQQEFEAPRGPPPRSLTEISLPESLVSNTSVDHSPVTSVSHMTLNSRDGRTPVESPVAGESDFDQSMAAFPMPASKPPTATAEVPSSPPVPLSPPFTPPATGPAVSVTAPTPMTDAGNFSPRSSKLQRKGAPAPLNLAQPTRSPPSAAPVAPSIDTPTDKTAGAPDDIERGRRRTRADDDRIRDAYVAAQEEARSLSIKSNVSNKSSKSKSKSKSKPKTATPVEQPHIVEPMIEAGATSSHKNTPTGPPQGLPPSPRPMQTPPNLAHLLSPTGSDSSVSSTAAHRSNISTPLLSPGLPMSPRPSDRPMYAPSPRLPKQMVLPGQPPLSPRPPFAQEPTSKENMSPSALPAPLFSKPAPTRSPPAVQAESPAMEQPHSASTMASSGRDFPSNIFRGLMSEQYPDLLLPPNALPSIDVKVFSSRLRPSRHSLLLANPHEEDPVFLLGIYARSSGKQLWRLEKTIHSLPALHQSVKSTCQFDGKLPEKSLFSGHAPAKIDARRAALNAYFDLLLDTPLSEQAALVVCDYFSTNVMEAEEVSNPSGLTVPSGTTPPTIVEATGRKEGYLTKRGKNFGGWKARYFVLDGAELKYYDSQGGPQIGVIKLFKAQIGKQSGNNGQDGSGREDEADNQYRHAFLVLEPKKKDSSSLVRHVLCAESDAERDAWVEALLKQVDQKEEKSRLENQSGRPGLLKSASQDSIMSQSKSKRRTQGGMKRVDEAPMETARTETPDSDAAEALVQGFSYENTVQGEEPVQGTTVSGYGGPRGMSSPQLNGTFSGMPSAPKAPVAISGPSNGAVIQNSEMWGLKTQTPVKEKKRSIFGFHRARTPSDATSGQSSTSSSIIRAPLSRPIFGMPLAEAVETAPPIGIDVQLPAVVYRCIEYLEAQGASSEEGIFRLSGSQNAIKGLRERFNTEGDVKLLDGTYYDVHAVASLLKLYLRELPSSVLTRDLHLDFLKALEIEDKPQKVAACNVLVHMLPPPNLELLSNLFSYLADIANASSINKMNVRNVAIVFAPTLNIPAPLLQLFLTDYPGVFGSEPEPQQVSPIREVQVNAPQGAGDGIRSPRHQMFSDLPTPGYNQSGFGQQAALPGFQPLGPPPSGPPPNRNTYAPPRSQLGENNGFPAPPVYPGGAGMDGGFASLNALSGGPAPEASGKKNRRESSMMGGNLGLVNQRQTSRQTLRDTSSSRIPAEMNSFAAQQRLREATPERRYQQGMY